MFCCGTPCPFHACNAWHRDNRHDRIRTQTAYAGNIDRLDQITDSTKPHRCTTLRPSLTLPGAVQSHPICGRRSLSNDSLVTGLLGFHFVNAPSAMARIAINRLTENQVIDQSFQAADKQMRVNRQGGKYLLLKLTDRTGTIAAMMWNVDERAFEAFNRGDYVHCRGRAQVHNGNLQLIVSELWRLENDQVELAEFDRFDSSEADRLLDRLRELAGAFRNVHLRRIAIAFLDDAEFVAKLRVAPAAVSNHHAFPGGLLKHTVDMMELAAMIGPRYPQLDTDLLACGAFSA